MNYTEYKNQLKLIKDQKAELNQQERNLKYNFIEANSPFYVDDIIEKNGSRIRISQIDVRSFWVDPSPEEYIQWVFKGTKYNQRNEPDKRATGYHQITYIEDFETIKLINKE